MKAWVIKDKGGRYQCRNGVFSPKLVDAQVCFTEPIILVDNLELETEEVDVKTFIVNLQNEMTRLYSRVADVFETMREASTVLEEVIND